MTRLDEIEARLAAATKGLLVDEFDRQINYRRSSGELVCFAMVYSCPAEQRIADVVFHAHAPDDLAALLAVVKAALGLVEAERQIEAGLEARDSGVCDIGYEMRDAAIAAILQAMKPLAEPA